jgi:hypothetical protein
MRPTRLALLLAATCLAVGALGGVAAANGVTDDTTIGANQSVTVGENGGEGDERSDDRGDNGQGDNNDAPDRSNRP